MASLEFDQLRTKFRDIYRAEPAIFRAPGRVNLIGEHTDYNDGFVMPAAIEFATFVAASARDDNRIIAQSLQYDSKLDDSLTDQRARAQDWTDYCWGVAQSLRDAGVK